MSVGTLLWMLAALGLTLAPQRVLLSYRDVYPEMLALQLD
jgi:hypothetical protein